MDTSSQPDYGEPWSVGSIHKPLLDCNSHDPLLLHRTTSRAVVCVNACQNLSSAATLGTLFTSDDPLPTGFEVTDGEVTYGIDNAIEPGAWVDYATFERAESATLSGTIRLTNPSTEDIDITW